MKTLLSISTLLREKQVSVPGYQRSYAWETDLEEKKKKQVNQFLLDLEKHISDHFVGKYELFPYFFGHLMFEENGKDRWAVIDGQQRLTTIVIFVCATYRRILQIRGLKKIEELDENIQSTYHNIVKKGYLYRFSTVEYDDKFLREYVIDQTNLCRDNLKTVSQERIADAFDYFNKKLSEKNEQSVFDLLKVVSTALVSTYMVKSTAEATQIFIFQNNRGKAPTKLDIIKAELISKAYCCQDKAEREDLLKNINENFAEVYKSISALKGRVSENIVLTSAIRVYINSLMKDINYSSFVDDVYQKLGVDKRNEFLKGFTLLLEQCFNSTEQLIKSSKNNIIYDYLLDSADKSIMLPFMLKARTLGFNENELNSLAKSLDQMFIRHQVTGTRANLDSRLNDCFKKMVDNVSCVVERIKGLTQRGEDGGYWNNTVFSNCLNKYMEHDVAKMLLWRYENHLRKEENAGYDLLRSGDINIKNLEHIAPQTENKEENNGYCAYDRDFKEDYLHCLGNYMLMSRKQNISLSNYSFSKKRDNYNQLRQQIEVQKMTEIDRLWNQAKIADRKDKIVKFIRENY